MGSFNPLDHPIVFRLPRRLTPHSGWLEHIPFAMLLVDVFFSTFTRKEVCDANKHTEVLMCISCDSRAQVDELVVKAMAAGGTVPRPPEDHGFMYSHGFEDLDGHIWELAWMNPDADVQQLDEAS